MRPKRMITASFWHLVVADSTPVPSKFICEFVAPAAPGQDCGVANWSHSTCSGNSQYTVNGGHSDEGFVVITLVNGAQRTQSFFGFTDSDLDRRTPVVDVVRQQQERRGAHIRLDSHSRACGRRRSLRLALDQAQT